MPQIITTEPLAQMLRSIALQKRTGMLRVERLGERLAEQGAIYFENGRPLRARAGQETGKAALQRIGEWKRVTCSFQGMSRPYPVITRSLNPSKVQEQAEARFPASRFPEVSPQTGKLARPEEQTDTERRQSVTGQPLRPGAKTTYPLNPRQAENALSVNAKSSIPFPSMIDNQPLVLHGSSLEKYEPVPPPQFPRSVQRWTTHLISEMETLRMPPKPPATPRLDLLPGEEELPGRRAIFKVRALVMTAQAIQQMERHARVVFILLDGRRTIQDIARLTHQTERDVEQILLSLTQHGYVEYVCG